MLRHADTDMPVQKSSVYYPLSSLEIGGSEDRATWGGHQGQPGEVTQRRKDGCAAGKSLSWGFFRKEQAGQAKPAYVLLVCMIPVDCGVQGLSQLSGTQPWVIRAGGQ